MIFYNSVRQTSDAARLYFSQLEKLSLVWMNVAALMFGQMVDFDSAASHKHKKVLYRPGECGWM